MNIRLLNFIHENKVLSFSFIFFALFSTSLHVFATPPSSPYGAGDTLDPSCAPGDTYCHVSGVTIFGYGSNGSVTPLGNNIFIGNAAGNRTMGSTAATIYDSSHNIGIGYDVMTDVSTGAYNIALGEEALRDTTTGVNNSALGILALAANTTGIHNTAVGAAASQSLTGGIANVSLGWGAGKSATSGEYNTFLGSQSVPNLISGDQNVIIGSYTAYYKASGNLTSIDNSVIIGAVARANDNGQTNQIIIGHDARGLGSNTTVIGNSSTTLTHLKGKLAIGGATSSSYQLHVGTSSVSGIVARFQNSTGTCDINPTTTSLSCSSDETLKTNIETLELDALDIINELRPVTYNWKTQADQETIPGFIAQEIETLLPKLVNTDPQTNLKSLNYTLFTPYIIKSIQELDEKVTTLTTSQHFFDTISTWLASATNGIGKIFSREIVTERICIADRLGNQTCLDKGQIDNLIANQSGAVVYTPASSQEPEEIIEEEEIIDEETPSEDTLTEEEEVIEETPEEVIEEEIIEEVEPVEEDLDEEALDEV